MKKCYVHLERLPKHVIKNLFVKDNMKKESPCQETVTLDDIKIEEHKDLNDNIYKDNVSHSLFLVTYIYIFIIKYLI